MKICDLKFQRRRWRQYLEALEMPPKEYLDHRLLELIVSCDIKNVLHVLIKNIWTLTFGPLIQFIELFEILRSLFDNIVNVKGMKEAQNLQVIAVL